VAARSLSAAGWKVASSLSVIVLERPALRSGCFARRLVTRSSKGEETVNQIQSSSATDWLMALTPSGTAAGDGGIGLEKAGALWVASGIRLSDALKIVCAFRGKFSAKADEGWMHDCSHARAAVAVASFVTAG